MTPDQLVTTLENLIENANKTLYASILRLQVGLYETLVLALKSLEVDGAGNIKKTGKNRRIIRDVQKEFNRYISGSNYQRSLENFLKTIPKIDVLNTAYFTSLPGAFSPNRGFLKALQKDVIRDVNKFILNDGLQANVAGPLGQILSNNINSGGSFSGMLEQLRDFIIGSDGKEGRLLKYARTYTTDTLFNYSRTWQHAVTSDLGLVWYLYSGGVVKDSRDFCRDRVGQFFTEKEIMSWAKLDWAGKNPQTTESSIFTFLGGWNCLHQLIAVHESVVPSSQRQRALELGYL